LILFSLLSRLPRLSFKLDRQLDRYSPGNSLDIPISRRLFFATPQWPIMDEPMPPTTVAVRLPNWVGDVCMALPALQLLLDTGCRLHLLGRGWARDLLDGLPVEVHALPNDMANAARLWRDCGCRHGVLLTNSLSSAIQARLGGVLSLGYRQAGRSLFLEHSLVRPTGRRHEVELLFSLARSFCEYHGLPVSREVPQPRLSLPLHPRHDQAAAAALQTARIEPPFLVIAPLAIGTIKGKSKAWPHFPELCRQLTRAGHRLVVCPGPGEEVAASQAAPGAAVLEGLSLGAYAAVCTRAQLVLANDSGPSHLAAAVNAPVLAVFGLGEPWRTSPWGGTWIGSETGWPHLAEVQSACESLLEHHVGDGQRMMPRSA
jgi:heptosyltransferase II